MNGSKAESAPSETDLRLELLAIDNPYIASALELCRGAEEMHQSGGDLADHLKAVRYFRPGLHGPAQSNLSDFQVERILQGIQSDPAKISDFQTRLEYVITENGYYGRDSEKAYREFKRNERPEIITRAELAANGDLDLGQIFESVTRNAHYSDQISSAKIAASGNLDQMFDASGRGYFRQDQINAVMAELAIDIDEPEAALGFIRNIERLEFKSDLFFLANGCETAAAMAVYKSFKNLKEELEVNPYLFCNFLVRCIEEVRELGNEEILEDTISVMTLTADPALFKSEPESDELKTRLVNNLVGRGYVNLARAARFTKQNDASEFGVTKYRNTLERGKNLDVESFDSHEGMPLLRRLRLRRIGHAALKDLNRNYDRPDNIKDIIGVAVLGFFVNHYDKSEKKQLAMRRKVREASVYERFPQLLKRPPDLTDLEKSLGNKDEADRIFQRIVSSRNYSILTKLKASVLMAGTFYERPDKQLHLQAQFLEEFERVSSIILPGSSDGAVEGIVNKSLHRRRCLQELGDLEGIANQLYDLGQRKEAQDSVTKLKRLLLKT